MLRTAQKYLTILVVLFGLLYLLYEVFMYSRARALLPNGVTIAGLDVSGLTRDEAIARLDEHYQSPLVLYHRHERVEIMPQDVGFALDLETMLREAETLRMQQEFWRGFLEYLVGWSLKPVQIELRATHDRRALIQSLETIAAVLDDPPNSPQLLDANATFEMGEAGYVTDIPASLPLVEQSLYSPVEREVRLVVLDEPAPLFDIEYLADTIRKQLSAFDGIGSVFVLDLQTGDEISINADLAMSGLSIVKIAILLETYRALDSAPTLDQTKLIAETAIQSGDFSANLLLDVIAGQDNAYLGVDILTESMHRLGLSNTFIITPYEEPSRAGKVTLQTPANMRTDLTTYPDPAMQTTAEDIGTLLAMIYHCSKGGGTLMAVYPDQLTPDECQAIIDVLTRNVEGNLIRYGVPETATVSHKHGWAGNTHGDAGIVYSPGGDYVIAEYLSQPLTEWLVIDISFPILREISRATYNYFNMESPNLEDPAVRAAREAEARSQTIEANPADVPAETETP